MVEPTTDNSAAAGVMVGGDQDEVRNELLAEVKRLRAPSGVPVAPAIKSETAQAMAAEYAELMAHMDGGGDYFEFMAKRRHAPGVTVTPSVPRLPACKQCDGKGERLENGTVFVCGGCLGNGVQMDENSPYTGESGWKLHRCADGEQCRAAIPGGCASGWCAHFGLSHEKLHPNIDCVTVTTNDQPKGGQ